MLGYKIFELGLKDQDVKTIRLYRMSTALQAVFLDEVNKLDPLLFDLIHNNSNQKPYTLSPPFKINDKYYFKLTSLNEDVSEFLKDFSFKQIKLKKENISFEVKEISSEFIAYKDFYHFFFTKDNEFEKKSDMVFSSPTSFRSSSSGLYVPLPQPVLIFQSISNKWSNFASFIETKDPELLNFIDKNIAISDFNIKTVKFPIDKGYVTSFTGSYSVFIKGTKYFRQLIKMLIIYAYFSGIGIKTSMGMGQVSYPGMSRVILDDTKSIFKDLEI